MLRALLQPDEKIANGVQSVTHEARSNTDKGSHFPGWRRVKIQRCTEASTAFKVALGRITALVFSASAMK